MNQLPTEILVNIFQCLPPQDVRRFRRLNKRSAGIIDRYDINQKIPVSIKFTRGECRFQTKFIISYENFGPRTAVVTLFTEFEEILIKQTKEDKISQCFCSSEFYLNFLENFVLAVDIRRLTIGMIYDRRSIEDFGRIVVEFDCPIGIIDFRRSSGSRPELQILKLIKREEDHPTVVFDGNNDFFLAPGLCQLADYFNMAFFVQTMDDFANIIENVLTRWLLNVLIVCPATVVLEDLDEYEEKLSDAEELIQRLVPDSECMRASDGDVLKFESFHIGETKLAVTFYAEFMNHNIETEV